MRLLTKQELNAIAKKYGWEFPELNAVTLVEGGGHGYDLKTGKILIQFEPSWFKRKKTDWKADTKHTLWQSNKVGDQEVEWKAFSNAFASSPDAAMQATSWGKMQVMGFHFDELGFKTVGDFVDFAKESEANQVELGCRFIKLNSKMDGALKRKDFATFAYYYNGEEYKKFNYDKRMQEAFLQSGGVMPPSNILTTTTNVNMRMGAGAGYKAIKVLPKGTKVKESYGAGVWSYVNDGKDSGWVSSEYLER